MINNFLELYQNRYGTKQFYENLLDNIRAKPDNYTTYKSFLSGYEEKVKLESSKEKIQTKDGDIRVDLPVWFGNPNAQMKIMLLGQEPRDTDKEGDLNIERVDKYVFATPFALERERPIRYHAAFSPLFKKEIDAFIYFTDVVKEYEVTGNKENDDNLAKKLFLKKAKENSPFLEEEIRIIDPTMIIAIGSKSHYFLVRHLKKSAKKISHPAHRGGIGKANDQLNELLAELNLKQS